MWSLFYSFINRSQTFWHSCSQEKDNSLLRRSSKNPFGRYWRLTRYLETSTSLIRYLSHYHWDLKKKTSNCIPNLFLNLHVLCLSNRTEDLSLVAKSLGENIHVLWTRNCSKIKLMLLKKEEFQIYMGNTQKKEYFLRFFTLWSGLKHESCKRKIKFCEFCLQRC